MRGIFTSYRFVVALAVWVGALSLAAPGARAQGLSFTGGGAKEPQAKARLVVDVAGIEAGKPFRAGFHFQIKPHWHIYSKEPGEVGLPTEITFTLPEGFTAAELSWPKPSRFDDQGLISYGYEDEVLLFATITPPATLARAAVSIQAAASWLVCKLNGQCIPGQTEDVLELTVAAAAPSEDHALFEKFAALVATDGPGLSPPADEGAQAPRPTPVTEMINPRPVSRPVAPAVSPAPRADESAPPFSFLKPTKAARETSGLLMLLFAFVGGLLLNVMPCVLPVISIKALSFARQAGNDRGHIFRLGVAFTAGVFVSFAALATLVIVAQSAGGALGWGFQFQEPRFVVLMSAVVVVFAMSLFGVFTIDFPGNALGRVEGLQRREGPQGAFFNGALATALATPCTAPMLGPALGFAFTQSAPLIFVFFMAIAAGLAAPYMALAAYPAWMKLLPRPGAWMDTFKHFMGFPLLATAVWLLWTLGRMAGSEGVIAAIAFLTATAFACWLLGLAFDLGASKLKRRTLGAAALLIVVGAYIYFPERNLRSLNLATDAAAGDLIPKPAADEIEWMPYTKEAVEAAVAEGRAVFLDFTADWCLTCKVNENGALKAESVVRAFKSRRVAAFKVDYTRQPREITRMLRHFGRAGVPLYVIFPAKNPSEPILMEGVLTPSQITTALEKAA